LKKRIGIIGAGILGLAVAYRVQERYPCAKVWVFEKEGGPGRLKVHHVHGILGNAQMQKKKKNSLFSHNDFLKPQRYYGSWDGAMVAQELTDKLMEKGCITIYNHPIWSRVSQEEFVNTKGLTALEIYNYNTVNESGTGYDSTYWDVMLRKGYKILGTASDDNHNQGLFEDSCGGYIVVKAEKLNHENIINAITDGNYYSSSGPEIFDWGISDGIIFVECSPVNRVNFIIGNYLNAGVTVMCGEINETMSEASYVLTGRESYVRVECIDKYGKTAWTNAIYLG
jgi:hypothetical protein